MRKYPFWQIDSFSRERYLGNPAAIVFEADSLQAEEMQTIARQMNLSETVFLCTPTEDSADYRARIFTPRSELPFAGHPTIAAAYAVFKSGRTEQAPDRLIQECGIGLVPIELSHDQDPLFTITMGTPSRKQTNVDDSLANRMLNCSRNELAEAPIEVCSAGLPWLIVPFRSLEGLTTAIPDQVLIEKTCKEWDAVGVTAYSPEAALTGCDFHIRSFAPGEGIPEDPVCGTGNGAAAIHIAAHLHPNEQSFSYVAEQGAEIGRKGLLHLSISNNGSEHLTIQLGGHAVTVMEGELFI